MVNGNYSSRDIDLCTNFYFSKTIHTIQTNKSTFNLNCIKCITFYFKYTGYGNILALKYSS